MTGFEFATAGRIVFGRGTAATLGERAEAYGPRVFIVTGSDSSRAAFLSGECFAIRGEPTIDMVREGVQAARSCAPDVIVGIGGGSAVDAGKAIAAMCTNDGELLDYLEVVGRGRPLEHPPLPYIAAPTTAGTGAEVTRNAVLGVPDQRVKVSMRSPLMLPALALVDPELTHAVPPAVTASTGLDALTQLIEPFLSPRATPMTDALCREAIPRAAKALPRVVENGDDADAREAMSLAALFSGLALANAGLGAAHGFAGPMGGMYDAPHGTLCACFLPHVLQANHRALTEREPGSPALGRFDELARMVTGSPTARAEDGLRHVAELCSGLDVPRLSGFGVRAADFPEIVEKAGRASSMKANPIALTGEELTRILAAAL